MYVNAASRDKVYNPLRYARHFLSQPEGLWLYPTSQTSLVVLPTGSRKTSSSAEFHRLISVLEMKHVARCRSRHVRERDKSLALRQSDFDRGIYGMAFFVLLGTRSIRRNAVHQIGDHGKLFIICFDTIGEGKAEDASGPTPEALVTTRSSSKVSLANLGDCCLSLACDATMIEFERRADEKC